MDDCQHCANRAYTYQMGLQCCQIRYLAGMPKDRRTQAYAAIKQAEGTESVNKIIELVNEQRKRK